MEDPKLKNLFFPLKIKIYILHARFIKGFVLVNQPMSVKQNGMWRLDIRSTIILVGSLNHQNIYIRISTICLPGPCVSAPKIDRTRENLEAFYIALIRPNLNEQCDSNVLTLFRNGIT